MLTPPVQAQIDRFWRRVGTLAAPVDPFDPLARGAALDRHSAKWLLDSLRIDGTPRVLLEQQLRDRFTVEPRKLSLLFLCQTFKRAGGRPPTATGPFRIRGGNDQLPNALANGLHDIRYSSWARRIELHAGGVRVHADGGDVLARFCVLTVPFPAVSTSIEFAPSLPHDLRDAIRLLRYGVATKVMIQYGEALLARQAGERLDPHRPHLPAVVGGDERTGGRARHPDRLRHRPRRRDLLGPPSGHAHRAGGRRDRRRLPGLARALRARRDRGLAERGAHPRARSPPTRPDR